MSGFIFGCVCEGQDVLNAVSETGQEMNLVTLGLESIAERKHVDPVIDLMTFTTFVLISAKHHCPPRLPPE